MVRYVLFLKSKGSLNGPIFHYYRDRHRVDILDISGSVLDASMMDVSGNVRAAEGRKVTFSV